MPTKEMQTAALQQVAASVTDMQEELHLIGKKVSCMEGRQAARQQFHQSHRQ